MIKFSYCLILILSVVKKSAMTLTKFALYSVFSLLFVNPTLADLHDEYFDDMITLKVGRYLTQDFYAVKSDFDGTNYINIKNFMAFTELSEYSQLSIEDGNINLSMSASLFADKKTRHIKKELSSLKATLP
jgi:hypothetical protein